jgi:hypothetical protein
MKFQISQPYPFNISAIRLRVLSASLLLVANFETSVVLCLINGPCAVGEF